MRPLLNPALRRVWRDGTTLQIGLDPDRAIVIGGLDERCARLVEDLDGTRDDAAVFTRAAEVGVEPERARRLLDLLRAGGVLTDAATDATALAVLDRTDRERLAPDLASAAIVHGGDPAAALSRRRAASVVVAGVDRVGSQSAMLLAASGVGRVVPEDRAPLRAADLAAAALDRSVIGERREDAVRSALRRLSPGTRTARSRRHPRPDVVVLCGAGPAQADDLVRMEVAHLSVGIRETTGIVGPFVLPGRTSCLRCQDLHRTDRDPAWPRVAAQLASARRDGRPEAPPCDTVLACTVAAHAALQVLAWLDGSGRTLPTTAGATLEISLPQGRVRRRSWPPHPACGCHWPRAG